ncbi:hypothetical protein GDO81_014719 [Engystomops pustulosus]|uniref:Ig-like domain-containing protein n=1 Tax=Engystomops pustulosus TaxID=76066 RepID=A0AAV7BCH1_ENGPU|nr:hypothetical protein GDO81_014719 [Engystomops pustulosus]
MWYKNFPVLVDSFLFLFLIGSQLWSGNVCERYPGYKITTSRSVVVQRGLCAHVPCSFTIPSDKKLFKNVTGIWYRFSNDTGYTIASKNNPKLQTNGRFFLTGNVASGNCSYYIENPIPADMATYMFRFESGPLLFSYRDIEPYVNVTELTDRPTISTERLVDGKEVTLTCTSPGRCRNIKPQFLWTGKITITKQKNYNKTYQDGSRTFYSSITFTPTQLYHKSPLYCKVTFKQDLITLVRKSLNIEYAPSMKIIIEGVDTNDTNSVIVMEGDTITLRCIVNSNPKASIYWYKDDFVVNQTRSYQTASVLLANVTPSDAGRFQCFAGNEHGVINATVHIIYYGIPLDGFPGEASEDSFLYKYRNIILPATIVPVGLLLLLALLVFACWRKRQNKLKSAEVSDTLKK